MGLRPSRRLPGPGLWCVWRFSSGRTRKFFSGWGQVTAGLGLDRVRSLSLLHFWRGSHYVWVYMWMYFAMYAIAHAADYLTPGSNSYTHTTSDSRAPEFIIALESALECLARDRSTKQAAFL